MSSVIEGIGVAIVAISPSFLPFPQTLNEIRKKEQLSLKLEFQACQGRVPDQRRIKSYNEDIG
jgi:hypothetical protein